MMVQVRERPDLREHEVEERFRELVERERLHGPPVVTKRRIRWMQWLAGFLVLALAAGVTAFMALRSDDTTSTYSADPYAEMELIDQAVAEFEATRPYVYVGSALAELQIIDQLVADYEAAHPYTYVADASTELALIDQLADEFLVRPSSYVPDAAAELALIDQLADEFLVRPSSYVPDAAAELALIDQLVADFEAGRLG